MEPTDGPAINALTRDEAQTTTVSMTTQRVACAGRVDAARGDVNHKETYRLALQPVARAHRHRSLAAA